MHLVVVYYAYNLGVGLCIKGFGRARNAILQCVQYLCRMLYTMADRGVFEAIQEYTRV